MNCGVNSKKLAVTWAMTSDQSAYGTKKVLGNEWSHQIILSHLIM